MIRKQGVVAAVEHSGCKMTHDRFRLYMEVAEHLVGLPPTKEPNAIRVHIRAQEGHRARGAEGASGYIAWSKAVRGAEDGDGEAE